MSMLYIVIAGNEKRGVIGISFSVSSMIVYHHCLNTVMKYFAIWKGFCGPNSARIHSGMLLIVHNMPVSADACVLENLLIYSYPVFFVLAIIVFIISRKQNM